MRAFERNLLELTRGLEDAVGDIVAEVAERVHGALVLATPVDTVPYNNLRAQSNWLVSINRADMSLAPLVSELETIKRGQAELRGQRLRASDEVVIANGGAKVPYLGLLNDGYSMKAPAGFVQAAVTVGAVAAVEARLLREGHGPLRLRWGRRK